MKYRVCAVRRQNCVMMMLIHYDVILYDNTELLTSEHVCYYTAALTATCKNNKSNDDHYHPRAIFQKQF